MALSVLSIAQMRAWENAAWASGQQVAEVIRLVGLQIARQAVQMTRPGESILILAGRGNNGADAKAAAPELFERRIRVLEVTNPAQQMPELTKALDVQPELVIDGLFGIGLDRPLEPDWIGFIDKVNASGSPVLSVDVPSGLNADTGKPEGTAIQASVTVCVGAPKIGLLSSAASEFVGRLIVADNVGLGNLTVESELKWIQTKDFAQFPPKRLSISHKGTFGHVLIIAGSEGFHGAACLCARGAQRARPGLVTLATMESVYPVVASQLQAPMVAKWTPEFYSSNQWSAVVIGPGLASPEVSEELMHFTRRLWRDSNMPMVVDASALGWLKPGPVGSALLKVVTPHPGEAARMLGVTVEQVQANRPATVRALSEKFGGCWVVLKGHQTLVGRHKGPIMINGSGGSSLAQGGSGDLLAGYIGGFLAQPGIRTLLGQALTYAVWQHGITADLLDQSRPNWVVEELAAALGSASRT